MPSTMPAPEFQRQPPAAAAGALFAAATGQAVLASEQDCLRQAALERPGQAGVWLHPAAETPDPIEPAWLSLQAAAHGFEGRVRCALPLPLANESCAVVVVQHLADVSADPGALLEECARVLIAGGRLWLLALNPLSPYRWRWRGHGVRAAEPVTWRRRLRAVGLVPDAVTRGLGPTWQVRPDPAVQDGAGLRAAYLLRAEKRRLPLTPLRQSLSPRWRPEVPAA